MPHGCTHRDHILEELHLLSTCCRVSARGGRISASWMTNVNEHQALNALGQNVADLASQVLLDVEL